MRKQKEDDNDLFRNQSIGSFETLCYKDNDFVHVSFLLPNGVENPVFLDSKFHSYDKHYNYVFDYPKDADTIEEYDAITNNGSPAIFSYLKFPEPSASSNKQDYLRICCQWKNNVNNIFGSFMTPVPRTSYNYLLKKPILLRKGDKNYRTFKPEKESLVAQNHLQLRNIVIDEEQFLPEEAFDFQFPNRNLVKMKDQVTQDSQWQSELLPMEVYPFMYDTYQEFKESYLRWNDIVRKEIKCNLKSLNEIGKECSICRAQVINRSNSLFIPIKKEEHKHIIIQPRDYSWTNKLKEFNDTEKLINFINESKEINNNSVSFKKNDDYFVINKYKGLFVNEFMNYGSTNLPINYFIVFRYIQKIDLERTIISVLNSEPQNIKNILMIPYSHNDIKRVFMEGNIENEITFNQLKDLLTFSKCSNETYLRYIFFLISVFNYKFTKEYSLALDLPENITMLYEITKRILSIETINLMIIEPTQTRNNINNQICIYHYFSSLLCSQSFDRDSLFYKYLLTKCREISRSLISTIKQDNDFRKTIWDSLYKENITDEYKILLMIVASTSKELKRMLLNPDLYLYSNEISNSNLGKRFLRILVSYDSNVLSDLFFSTNYEDILSMLKNSNQFLVYILRDIFYLMNNNIDRIKFKSDILFQLFIDSVNINLYKFINILEPILSILVENTPNKKSKTSQEKFSSLLPNLISQIQTSEDFNKLINILILFTSFTSCNLIFVSSSTFSQIICSNISSTHVNTILTTWNFIFKVCQDPDSTNKFIEYDYFFRAIDKILMSNDPISLSKFFKFLTTQISLKNSSITDTLMHICTKLSGKLSCLFVALTKKFSTHAKTLKHIHLFLSSLRKLQSDSITSFVVLLCNHLNSNGSEGVLLIKKYFRGSAIQLPK